MPRWPRRTRNHSARFGLGPQACYSARDRPPPVESSSRTRHPGDCPQPAPHHVVCRHRNATMMYWGWMQRVTLGCGSSGCNRWSSRAVRLTQAQGGPTRGPGSHWPSYVAMLLDVRLPCRISRTPHGRLCGYRRCAPEISAQQTQTVASAFAHVEASQVHHVAPPTTSISGQRLQTPAAAPQIQHRRWGRTRSLP